MADELHPATEIFDVTKSEHYYEEIEYQAKSWPKSGKVIVQSVRPSGELFFYPFLFCNELKKCIHSRNYRSFLSKKRDDGELYQGS